MITVKSEWSTNQCLNISHPRSDKAISIKYFRSKMLKKLLTIGIVLLALATIVFVYFKLRDIGGEKTDPWTLVPESAAAVVQITSFDKTDEAISWLSNFVSDSGPSTFPYALSGAHVMISKLAEKRKNDEQWSALLASCSVLIYTSSTSLNNSWSSIIPLDKTTEADFANLIKGIDFSNTVIKTFEGSEIFENSTLSNYCTLLNHCLVWSGSLSGIESAILASKESRSAGFNRMQQKLVQTMAKDVPIHLFFRDNSDWWQTDLINMEGSFQLAGFAHLGDSGTSSLNYVAAANQIGVHKIVPANASILESKSYSSFDAGWELSNTLNAGSQADLFWSQAWKDLGDSCSCDLNEVVLSWRGGEWGNFVFDAAERSHTISFVSVKEGENVLAKLQPLLGADTARHMGSPLFSIKMPQVFDRNSFFRFMNNASYGTVLGHYVCFSSDPESLKILIDQYHSRATFEHQPPSGQSMENLSAGWLVVQQDYSISPLPEHFMNCFGNANPIRASISELKKGLCSVNISLGQVESVASVTDISSGSGKVELSSPVSDNGPWFVKNHNSGELEIIAQDQQNNLYLIDQDGKVLWTKQIDGKIKGEVQQVDALKNGKLQLLFSTSSQLYLIDRNGNAVSGFPVKYESPLKSDLYVFDYDRSKNYRILGGLENGAIFNYTVDGKTATGWNHQKTSKAVTSIHHIRIGGDDWLVSILADNRVQCLRRNGVLKYEPKSILTGFDGKSAVCVAASSIEESAITFYSGAGKLTRLKFNQQDGGVVNDVPANINPIISDMDGDGKNDFVLSSGTDVFIYDFANKLKEKIQLSERPEGNMGVGIVGSRKVLTAPLSDGKSYAIAVPGGVLRELAPQSSSKILLADMDGDAMDEAVLVKGAEIKVISLVSASETEIN